MNKILQIFLSFLGLMGLIFLSSCETDEQVAIAKAQICLDKATAATANLCKDHVTGLSSPASYIIRCSADFLTKGLTATKMAQSFINRDRSTTNKDPMLGFMGILAFETNALASQAYDDCKKSGVKSFLLFGSMSRISTKIGSFSTALDTIRAGENPTQAEMETAIDAISLSDTATLEILGDTAKTLGTSYCNAGNATTDVCKNVNEAIANNTTSAAIGTALLTALKNK